jgi:hypothetical protein
MEDSRDVDKDYADIKIGRVSNHPCLTSVPPSFWCHQKEGVDGITFVREQMQKTGLGAVSERIEKLKERKETSKLLHYKK